jgi:CRISPR-associated endonuclease/helicase Cas3
LYGQRSSGSEEMRQSYWAKTNADGTPGIEVHQHLLRVGLVAGLLAEQSRTWFERFGIGPAGVSALAGLHDVGKISPR